ncbi:MAG: ribbon-helix-helix protein, CopG family [Cyanobacteria bacterium J06621_15]
MPKFPITVPFRMSEAEIDLLKKIAEAEQSSVSEILRTSAKAYICDYLEDNEAISELTSENIAA